MITQPEAPVQKMDGCAAADLRTQPPTTSHPNHPTFISNLNLITIQRQLSLILSPYYPKAPIIIAIMPIIFFNLPGEIRTMIYEALLIAPDVLTIDTADTSHMYRPPYIARPPQRPSPAILATCQRARDEALPILYSQNSFRFGFRHAPAFRRAHENSHAIFACFLRLIGPRNAGLIRTVCVEFPAYLSRYSGGYLVDGYSMANFELMQDKCPGVTGLDLDLYRDTNAKVLAAVRMYLERKLPGLKSVKVSLQDGRPLIADDAIAERLVSREVFYGELADLMKGWGWEVEMATVQRLAPSRLVRGRIIPTDAIYRPVLR